MPEWSDVQASIGFFSDYESVIGLNENVLFDEFLHVKKIICQNIEDWNARKLPVSQCWVAIFQQCKDLHIIVDNICKMVEFVLCVPGTNAYVERIFSLMNMYWTEEKSRLNVETLKAVLIEKTHFHHSCSEFYDYLMQNKELLQKIHTSEKYM